MDASPYWVSFYTNVLIFVRVRMMDTGKKRMITLKKAERDRKKHNEIILKRLKTLDAENWRGLNHVMILYAVGHNKSIIFAD